MARLCGSAVLMDAESRQIPYKRDEWSSNGGAWLPNESQWLSNGYQWMKNRGQWLSNGYLWLKNGLLAVEWLPVDEKWIAVAVEWLPVDEKWIAVAVKW